MRGEYDGPDFPDKGQEGGHCNVTTCQAEGAIWYNYGSLAWYCEDCRNEIQFDEFNLRHWDRDWRPRLGHDMFLRRQDMAPLAEGRLAILVPEFSLEEMKYRAGSARRVVKHKTKVKRLFRP